MPSFRTAITAVATALVATVQADYYIEPSSVSLAIRQSWCSSEKSTCPLICEDMGSGGAEVNTCDATALSYGCLCDDGKTPNVSEYSLTLPYFVCQEWGNQCVTACGSDNDCAGDCRQDHPCGALDPTPANKTNSTTTASGTASSTASSTSTDAAVFTNLGGSGGDSSSAGPPTFEMTRLYTTFGTLGMFFAGFAFLL